MAAYGRRSIPARGLLQIQSFASVEEMCGYTTRVLEEGRLRADRAKTSVRPVGICEGGGERKQAKEKEEPRTCCPGLFDWEAIAQGRTPILTQKTRSTAGPLCIIHLPKRDLLGRDSSELCLSSSIRQVPRSANAWLSTPERQGRATVLVVKRSKPFLLANECDV